MKEWISEWMNEWMSEWMNTKARVSPPYPDHSTQSLLTNFSLRNVTDQTLGTQCPNTTNNQGVCWGDFPSADTICLLCSPEMNLGRWKGLPWRPPAEHRHDTEVILPVGWLISDCLLWFECPLQNSGQNLTVIDTIKGWDLQEVINSVFIVTMTAGFWLEGWICSTLPQVSQDTCPSPMSGCSKWSLNFQPSKLWVNLTLLHL
jgi:hypothetical protein